MSEKINKFALRCPRCGGPSRWEGNPDRPFCSERCRLIDLGRWAAEEYRIAGQKAGPELPDNVIEFPKPTKDQKDQ